MTRPLYWAVIPAAGAGRRMGGPIPKQYLQLQGRTVLDHAIGRLLSVGRIRGVRVALSSQDEHWQESRFAADARVVRVAGGVERCHSVRNALHDLATGPAAATDWVLVHDAARPCVRPEDIERLMDRLDGHPVGGLLASPIHDTVKQVDEGNRVRATLPRESLWRAFTPQMFRIGVLLDALEQALSAGRLVTDEAGAMELAGLAPLLVEGSPDNIKITRPGDLALAGFLLRQQEIQDTTGAGES